MTSLTESATKVGMLAGVRPTSFSRFAIVTTPKSFAASKPPKNAIGSIAPSMAASIAPPTGPLLPDNPVTARFGATNPPERSARPVKLRGAAVPTTSRKTWVALPVQPCSR